MLDDPARTARRVIIVGGGASGVLAALHLLRDRNAATRVCLIETCDRIGKGVAYSTDNPEHLLNVRASNMSAYPDDPGHFWRWLVSRGQASDLSCSDPFCFVPRRIFGRYLEDEIREHLWPSEGSQRLEIVNATCVSLSEGPVEVTAHLSDGRTRVGDVAVLATGLGPTRPSDDESVTDPWDATVQSRLASDDAVLVLGTGLTMVDYLLSMLGRHHSGPIYAISRRGLTPQPHRRAASAMIDVADVPLGESIGQLWRWVRHTVHRHAQTGGDWRGAIDGLRPFTQTLWQRLPASSKARFLRHAQPWWSILRHRMAPEVHTRVRAAIARGQLRIIAAKVVDVEALPGGSRVTFRRRGTDRRETLTVAAVVECRGMSMKASGARNPLVTDLLTKRRARLDDLGLGLDVDHDCALIDADGGTSSRMFAIGPLTRGTFWESIAVPDIARQCQVLAHRLSGDAQPTFPGRWDERAHAAPHLDAEI